MPWTKAGAKFSRPVNSLVKKVCLSFGSDAIALRSSMGAQATPTVYMVMPSDWWVGKTGYERNMNFSKNCTQTIVDFSLF